MESSLASPSLRGPQSSSCATTSVIQRQGWGSRRGGSACGSGQHVLSTHASLREAMAEVTQGRIWGAPGPVGRYLQQRLRGVGVTSLDGSRDSPRWTGPLSRPAGQEACDPAVSLIPWLSPERMESPLPGASSELGVGVYGLWGGQGCPPSPSPARPHPLLPRQPYTCLHPCHRPCLCQGPLPCAC